MKEKILLVDDETDILEFLTYNLVKEGYEVYTAKSGEEAVEKAKTIKPDLVVLDVMMPGMDGMDTCRQLRNTPGTENVLIAFLTARSEDYSQVAGFDAGADDYINKPVKPKILLSRLKALLKRKSGSGVSQETLTGEITIDRSRYLVLKNGQEIQLPKKEFELLSFLSSKPGHVFTRDSLLEKIWGEDVIVGERTIDVHIRKLREKLGEDHFKTIKGIGYKFES